MKRFLPTLYNNFFVGGILLLVVMAASLWLIYKSFSLNSFLSVEKETSGAKHIVVLDKDGFSPPVITIKKGDYVTFMTKRGKPFWPASNLHPLHTDYLEFDPKRPVAPDESWSFQFDKTGKWTYHDHLYPFFTGTIQVLP